MVDVVEAVAQTFDRTPEEIAMSRGTLERRVIAYLAFEDGLIPLRKIARALGVTSAGGISNLVRRCRREMVDDEQQRELVDTCRNRMRRRPPEFAFPRMNPPVTARRYHRLASRSRR